MKANYEKGGQQKDVYDKTELIRVCCPLCENDKCASIYKERGCLEIVKCVNCGLIYVNPRLANPEKIYWGDREKYLKEAKLIFEGKLPHHRDKNYCEDLKLIYRYKPSGEFLDVGANMGFFLRNARKYENWNLFGVEPSPVLSDIARKHFGLNIKTSFLENSGFENEYFDIITMTDVFEHVINPKNILGEVRRILKQDGILFIRVPNVLLNIFKLKVLGIFGKFDDYDIFDSYEHVVHYSADTLRIMLEKQGFIIKNIKIGKPVQLPAWHKHVGAYYQYPSPWFMDYKKRVIRSIFHVLSKIEFYFTAGNIGCFASNIIVVAKKKA